MDFAIASISLSLKSDTSLLGSELSSNSLLSSSVNAAFVIVSLQHS